MKRIAFTHLARPVVLLLLIVVGVGATTAFATSPPVNGAYIHTRIFNDCPSSTVTTSNIYPSSITIDDEHVGCLGFANLHNWSFSSDGGTSPAVFMNSDGYSFAADLVISGLSDGEAGLRVSPWWSPDVDGVFNCRTTDGEIACFGGRLPFFTFTGAFGLHYVKGTSIHLQITYLPNGLSMTDPATIQYTLTYGSINYTSGKLAFDEGNPAEGYGSWGELNFARVGGRLQVFLTKDMNDNTGVQAVWSNITFDNLATPVIPTTWGHLKALYSNR